MRVVGVKKLYILVYGDIYFAAQSSTLILFKFGIVVAMQTLAAITIFEA
jgi:hypothetical protein